MALQCKTGIKFWIAPTVDYLCVMKGFSDDSRYGNPVL